MTMESAITKMPMGVRLLAPAARRRVSGTAAPIAMRHLGGFRVTSILFTDQVAGGAGAGTEARWLLEMSP
jgi:hypothetical protein